MFYENESSPVGTARIYWSESSKVASLHFFETNIQDKGFAAHLIEGVNAVLDAKGMRGGLISVIGESADANPGDEDKKDLYTNHGWNGKISLSRKPKSNKDS